MRESASLTKVYLGSDCVGEGERKYPICVICILYVKAIAYQEYSLNSQVRVHTYLGGDLLIDTQILFHKVIITKAK